jgi:hypothetical protein
MAYMNGHLRRAWSRNEVGRAQHVEKIRPRHPGAPADEFFLHHSDMCCRAAEGDRAEPQERESNWPQF